MGPIPCGLWDICGPPYSTKTHGPYVLRLEPEKWTVTFGRTGFLMHGDSKQNPGDASEGCIIQGPLVRMTVWQSGDRRLRVIADHADLYPVPDLDGNISV